MKVLITGATGFVGNALVKKFLREGHEVNILTRNPDRSNRVFANINIQAFEWSDPSNFPPREAFIGINGIINLMGENLAAKRWTFKQKELITSSRVDSTINMIDVINDLHLELDFFVNASAVGIYPVNVDQTLDESSALGNGFLSEVCKEWEKTLLEVKKVKRKICVRTGMVLGKNGGALEKMLPIFKLGLGGPLGNGEQIISWIHLDDLVEIYYQSAVNSNYSGIYNGVSPLPVSNLEFTKSLCEAIGKPMFLKVPAFALNLALGEMSSILLDSQRVIPTHLSGENFKFKYPHIDEAFAEIFK